MIFEYWRSKNIFLFSLFDWFTAKNIQVGRKPLIIYFGKSLKFLWIIRVSVVRKKSDHTNQNGSPSIASVARAHAEQPICLEGNVALHFQLSDLKLQKFKLQQGWQFSRWGLLLSRNSIAFPGHQKRFTIQVDQSYSITKRLVFAVAHGLASQAL